MAGKLTLAQIRSVYSQHPDGPSSPVSRALRKEFDEFMEQYELEVADEARASALEENAGYVVARVSDGAELRKTIFASTATAFADCKNQNVMWPRRTPYKVYALVEVSEDKG